MNEPTENIVVSYIRQQLPDIGQGVAGQMVDLARNATAERCDNLLLNLRGCQNTVLRLREALEREGKENA